MKVIDIPISMILLHTNVNLVMTCRLRATLGIRLLEIAIELPTHNSPVTPKSRHTISLFTPSQLVLVREQYYVTICEVDNNYKVKRANINSVSKNIAWKPIADEGGIVTPTGSIFLQGFQLAGLETLANRNKSLSVLVE